MTLYFDNNLPDVPGPIEEVLFSSFHPLAACRSHSRSTGQGVISIFNTDSELIDTEVASLEATAILWHPSKPILATAWSSGRISLWNGETKERQAEAGMEEIWAFTLAIEQMAKLVMSMRKVKKRLSSQWRTQCAMSNYLVRQSARHEWRQHA